jgi:type I restriction enzyme S subunit
MPRTSWEKLGDYRIEIPSVRSQQGISDYLDRETARIDALLKTKQRLAELLEERWQGLLESTIRDLSSRGRDMPLKYACREVVVGIVITPSAWYAETGVPAIRGLNVTAGRISSEDLVYLTPEGDQLHPKSRLKAGDVVIVRTGQAGAAAVVPPALDGANCIDLVIVRPKDRLDPQYLEMVLNSDWMQKHVDEYSVGTIQSHFNVEAAKNVPLPLPEPDEQAHLVRSLQARRDEIAQVIKRLARQLEVLRERRQALITAAVTGGLEIPEVAA